MTPKNNQPEKAKTYKFSVALKVPPPVPNYEFLQRKVNTKMTFCGNIEKLISDGATTKLMMAQGHLNLLLDESVKHNFEAFLHKNVCVQGFLTPMGEDFQMIINDLEQIWLTGH